ncbi:MAG TPA: N-acyl homoserine lactonase family protein [Sphingomicrobium sp.]|nr:N-acyl homoserine lactonase family protein [Sphingomicrobium sp.]
MILPLLVAAAACDAQPQGANDASPANATAAAAAAAPLSLTRLDCGTATIKDFDSFFSDRPGLYEKGPRDVVDSCYLIRHADHVMVWDTGFSGALKGGERDMGHLVARLDRTVAEQLAELGIKPEDVDVVGISHLHSDHVGQAADFPNARLLVGKGDFEQTKGKDDPFGPWRKEGANLTLAEADIDLFGDGSVKAIHLPGHTPNHLALLVGLKSGPVLLSGDLYHSRDAREKRGVPPFNTSREQTLASMDAFEKLAKETGAKVVIQHEPRDVGLLPAFPKAAE